MLESTPPFRIRNVAIYGSGLSEIVSMPESYRWELDLALYTLNVTWPVGSVCAPQSPVLSSPKEVCEFDIL